MKDEDAVVQTDRQFRRYYLQQLKNSAGMRLDELSLFEWSVNETEKLYSQIRVEEEEYIQKQILAGIEDVNDSGMAPVEYFIRRSRYSHIVYLCSLGEVYLVDACHRLGSILGENLIFAWEELDGDKWRKSKLFLERYGYGKNLIPDNVWKPFSRIYFVRNTIVHNNGYLDGWSDKKKEEFAKNIKNVAGVSIESDELVVDEVFISASVNALRSFTAYVNRMIGQVIDHAISPRAVQ